MGPSKDYLSEPDTTLIDLIAGAHAAALAQLYDRYHRLIYSLAVAIVGDSATAEEITLDVFVRVWQKAGTYRPDLASVSTWLTRITRHHAIDELRRWRARPERHSIPWVEMHPSTAPEAHDPLELMELSLRREHVRAAVAQLPAEQQRALVLAYFQGYTHRQIAEALDEPLGTVKTRIRLAMQKLRQMLQDEGWPPDKSNNARAAYNMVEEV